MEIPRPRKKLLDRSVPLSDADHGMLLDAERYGLQPNVLGALAQMDLYLDNREHDPRFSEVMNRLLRNVSAALDTAEMLRSTQEQHGLIDHRHYQDTETIEKALAAGRWAQEVDIRFDKSGTPWVQHDPTFKMGGGLLAQKVAIDTLDSEAIEAARPTQLSLEKLMQQFERYKKAHRLVLEVKTLGSTPDEYREKVDVLERLLEHYDMRGSVAFSSISPTILTELAARMPEVPLMWNGGIVPWVSYAEQGTTLVDSIVPDDAKWRAYGVGQYEVVVSANPHTVYRDDGERKTTGYIHTVVPYELLRRMREQLNRRDVTQFTGIVSLSTVTLAASVMDVLGCTQAAQKLRRDYSSTLQSLGLGTMATIRGDEWSGVPGLRSLDTKTQLAVIKRDLGLDALVYTKDPEIWASALPTHILEEFDQQAEVV